MTSRPSSWRHLRGSPLGFAFQKQSQDRCWLWAVKTGSETSSSEHMHLPPPLRQWPQKSVHLWAGLQPSPPSVHSPYCPRIHPPYCPSVPPTSPALLPAGQPLLEALTPPPQEGSSTAWLNVPSYSLKYTFMLWMGNRGSVKLGPSMQCSQPLKPCLTPKPCFIQATGFQTLPGAF